MAPADASRFRRRRTTGGDCLHGLQPPTYGHLIATGYGNLPAEFRLSYFWPRLEHFTLWLSRFWTPLALLLWLGVLYFAIRRERRYLLVAAWFLPFVAFYSFYFHSDHAWWYLRFILPGIPGLLLGALMTAFDMKQSVVRRWSSRRAVRPLLAGALLATDDEAVIARYRQFGWALGLAFQLNDDLLGIWGREQSTGKEPSDLAKHKKTLPVIYALEHASPGDRARLLAIYADPEPTAGDLTEAMAIVDQTGAQEYTRGEARRWRDEAIAALDSAGVIQPEARAKLEQIMRTVISA